MYTGLPLGSWHCRTTLVTSSEATSSAVSVKQGSAHVLRMSRTCARAVRGAVSSAPIGGSTYHSGQPGCLGRVLVLRWSCGHGDHGGSRGARRYARWQDPASEGLDRTADRLHGTARACRGAGPCRAVAGHGLACPRRHPFPSARGSRGRVTGAVRVACTVRHMEG